MMHAGEERESKEERGVGGTFDWTVRPQWKLFHDPVRPFPHDVAGIFGRDSQARYLSPRNMAHPGRPGSPVYLETASRYSLPRTCPLSRLLPHLPGRNFSKILDAPTCSKGVRTLLHPSVSLPLSSSLSLFFFLFLFLSFTTIRLGLFLVSIFPHRSALIHFALVALDSFEEFFEVGWRKR